MGTWPAGELASLSARLCWPGEGEACGLPGTQHRFAGVVRQGRTISVIFAKPAARPARGVCWTAFGHRARHRPPPPRRPGRRCWAATSAAHSYRGHDADRVCVCCTSGLPTPTIPGRRRRIPLPCHGPAGAAGAQGCPRKRTACIRGHHRPAGMSATWPQGPSASRLNKPAELRSPQTRDGERTTACRRTLTRGGRKLRGQTEAQKTDSDFTQMLAAAPTTVFYELRHPMAVLAGERVDAPGPRADTTGTGKGLRRADGLDRPGQSSLPLLHQWRLRARRLPQWRALPVGFSPWPASAW